MNRGSAAARGEAATQGRVDTPTPCSCAGCRKPRMSSFSSGWGRLSLGERRFLCESEAED